MPFQLLLVDTDNHAVASYFEYSVYTLMEKSWQTQPR